MALAAYGSSRFVRRLERAIDWKGALPVIRRDWFDFGITPRHPSLVSREFQKEFGPARISGGPVTEREADLAFALQEVTAGAVVRLATWAGRATRAKNIVIGGGVALNCVIASRVRREGPFERLFIPPGPNDSGTSIGASMLGGIQLHPHTRPASLTSAFLGPEYSDDDVIRAANGLGLKFSVISNREEAAAKLLLGGEIVGWFQGRLEFGPRALGNRSLLADPSNPNAGHLVNEIVKHRQSFRPFAPAVLADRAADIFEMTEPIPFMTEVARVRPSWRDRIVAVIHADGTARVQTVSEEVSPKFYRLIEIFARGGGVPLLLNTSLNGPDEPIVCTPDHALKLFVGSKLRHLFIGDVLFQKG